MDRRAAVRCTRRSAGANRGAASISYTVTNATPAEPKSTAATTMVNGGASFKDVADVLGHQSLATTLIYAKLDLRSLMQVALPWPGGGR